MTRIRDNNDLNEIIIVTNRWYFSILDQWTWKYDIFWNLFESSGSQYTQFIVIYLQIFQKYTFKVWNFEKNRKQE